MTIPVERAWSVRNVRKFLKALADPTQTKRIPSEIRCRAAQLLKHYPGEFYIEESQKKAPEIWGEFKEPYAQKEPDMKLTNPVSIKKEIK